MTKTGWSLYRSAEAASLRELSRSQDRKIFISLFRSLAIEQYSAKYFIVILEIENYMVSALKNKSKDFFTSTLKVVMVIRL